MTWSPEPLTPDQWRAVLLADPCAYCGAPAADVDHITPQRAGGDDSAANLAGACARCNQRKWSNPLVHFLGWRLVADAAGSRAERFDWSPADRAAAVAHRTVRRAF